VVTGELIAPTLGPTRTEEDFVAHIERTIALDPEARYVFVLDNLNIHCSAGLVELVARLCGLEEDLGKKGKRGRCSRCRRGRSSCRTCRTASASSTPPSTVRG
jgi:hypothetical protein